MANVLKTPVMERFPFPVDNGTMLIQINTSKIQSLPEKERQKYEHLMAAARWLDIAYMMQRYENNGKIYALLQAAESLAQGNDKQVISEYRKRFEAAAGLYDASHEYQKISAPEGLEHIIADTIINRYGAESTIARTAQSLFSDVKKDMFDPDYLPKQPEGGGVMINHSNLSQEELATRGQTFLDTILRYIFTKIQQHNLSTTVGYHFMIGYEGIQKGKGKHREVQKERGVISTDYSGQLVQQKVGTFRGVAYQLGNTSDFPISIDQPTVFIAERFDISSRIPSGEVALVSVHGGRNSHVATLANERGIPGIVGVGNASDISSGEQLLLELSGSKGRVYRLAQPKSL